MDACPKCNGSGWIFGDKDGVEYAHRCTCVLGELFTLRAERANIPERFKHSSFDNFKITDGSVGLGEAIEKSKIFAGNFESMDRGLLLQGTPGIGKTKLLCSMLNAMLKRKPGMKVMYIDWNDLVRDLGSGESFESRDFSLINKLTSRIKNSTIVMFDELGATRPSEYVKDKIYDIINTRYNRMRLTCFATNWPDDDPQRESLQHRIGARLRSRITQMTDLCQIKARDYRRVR